MSELLEEREVLQRRIGETAGPEAGGPELDLRGEIATVAAALERARQECDRAEENARLLQRRLDEARHAPAAPAVAPGAMNDRVMAMAQRTADDHLREAQRESEALTTQARQQSERVTREALAKVHDIEEESDRRQRQAEADLIAGDAALRREVQQLESLAKGYRNALAEHVQAQSRQLDTLGAAGDDESA